MFINCTAALEYLHFHNIVHGNINPENIFCSDDKYILGGYAMKNIIRKESSNPKLFIPPEYNGNEYTKEMDIYCLGMTVIAFATHYHIENLYPTKNELLNGFINMCINPDPHNRPNVHLLYERLSSISAEDIYHFVYCLKNESKKPDRNTIKSLCDCIKEDNKSIEILCNNNGLFSLCESFKNTDNDFIMLDIIGILNYIYEKNDYVFKYRITDVMYVITLILKSREQNQITYEAIDLLKNMCSSNSKYKGIISF